MIVLCRRKGETLIINDQIEVYILDVTEDHVRLGIEAPQEVDVIKNQAICIDIRKAESRVALFCP